MATATGLPRRLSHSSESARYHADVFTVVDLSKPEGPIYTGLGFLDHMLDQFHSHAQIGVAVTLGDFGPSDKQSSNVFDRNRFAGHDDQAKLLSLVGGKLGTALRRLLNDSPTTGRVSSFSCPLDEALVACVLERRCAADNDDDDGRLHSYTLPPYGSIPPKTGRTHLGRLQTEPLPLFWQALAQHSGLVVNLRKVRGENGHHIVESSFKAFCRALRNLLDGVDTCTESPQLLALYGPDGENWKQSTALGRQGSVARQTKETAIAATLRLDGGEAGVTIATGLQTLDTFFTTLAQSANMSLDLKCQGDLWIDEHHTAEDSAIAVGQVIHEALGSKAGLNRMWCAAAECGHSKVQVTLDLSNRPCLVHNLSLEGSDEDETIGDLSCEMFLHVLESLVLNGRMTCHVVQLHANPVLSDTLQATAVAFGKAFYYCASVDQRRSGGTASSKGTLSV